MSTSISPKAGPRPGVTRRGLLTGALGAVATCAVAAKAAASGPSIYSSSNGSLFTPAAQGAPGPLFGPGQAASPWRGPAEFGLGPRTLGLYNAHTDERLDVTYWQRGSYDNSGLARLNAFMRDWRTDEITEIDPKLYDVLWSVGQSVGRDPEFTVLSGYRSRATNNMLISSGHSGVARESLHIRGKAIDVTLPGTALSQLHRSAVALQAGGVGYYPSSNFVHLDTGQVRSW